MKKELFKNVGYTLGNLLDNIEIGVIGLRISKVNSFGQTPKLRSSMT